MTSSDTAVSARCPVCSEPQLRMRTMQHEVPYFGECMETLIHCEACNFRHADFMILTQKDPMRHELVVQGADDLAVRVVRSNSGTIRVPELGFLAEPTPQSEAFVSNVQGIFERVRDVLIRARSVYGDEPDSVRIAEEKLLQLARIESGEEVATLIIDDPLGNSAILSERVATRPLTQDEVAELQTGMIVLDKNDLA